MKSEKEVQLILKEATEEIEKILNKYDVDLVADSEFSVFVEHTQKHESGDLSIRLAEINPVS